MGAAEDIINEKLSSTKPVGYAQSMRTGEGLNPPKSQTPTAATAAPAKTWVQELKEHVQSMFRRKKKMEASKKSTGQQNMDKPDNDPNAIGDIDNGD